MFYPTVNIDFDERFVEVSDKFIEPDNRPVVSVKAKQLSNTAILPTYGSKKAACMDLYADIKSLGVDKVYIGSGDCFTIPTGFAFQPPVGFCGLIFARSGMSVKKGLRPSNAVGVCDEDFVGNYTVALYNDSKETQVIEHGDRIAQLMFIPYYQTNLIEVDELTETERGEGSFGSTGIK